MARPQKIGLDYFPLDTNTDIKLELISAKFGLEGFGCIIKLFQKIYEEGYLLKWDEDIKLLFARQNYLDISKLNEIILFAFQKDIFNFTMYEKYNILTSHGIQARWKKIITSSGRLTSGIDEKYDLCGKKEFPPQETLTPPIFPGEETIPSD
jgi:hypothetical protein